MAGFNLVKLLDPIQMTIAGTFTPKGAYDNATDYSIGDMVDYNGSSYIMYSDAAAGTVPTDSTKWGLVAAKGNTGATGAAGPQGIQGTAGNNGADGADGREVELQKSATHIQWRYVGDVAWIDLVALADLKGDTGNTGPQGLTGNTGPAGDVSLSQAMALSIAL